MAQITAISRCAGLNHIHLTVTTPRGSRSFTILQSDLSNGGDDETLEQRLLDRLKQLIREARAAGNTSFAQIRTYVLNREFIE